METNEEVNIIISGDSIKEDCSDLGITLYEATQLAKTEVTGDALQCELPARYNSTSLCIRPNSSKVSLQYNEANRCKLIRPPGVCRRPSEMLLSFITLHHIAKSPRRQRDARQKYM